MSVAKVIEILAEGSSIEDAAESALKEASKSVEDIKHLYIKEFQALVENNQIVRYRINAKVTFLVNK